MTVCACACVGWGSRAGRLHHTGSATTNQPGLYIHYRVGRKQWLQMAIPSNKWDTTSVITRIDQANCMRGHSEWLRLGAVAIFLHCDFSWPGNSSISPGERKIPTGSYTTTQRKIPPSSLEFAKFFIITGSTVKHWEAFFRAATAHNNNSGASLTKLRREQLRKYTGLRINRVYCRTSSAFIYHNKQWIMSIRHKGTGATV